MTTQPADRTGIEMDIVAARAEIERLTEKVRDLEDQLAGARQSVTDEQRANRAHALECRVVRRPAGGWPPIPAADDVPTRNLT